MKRFLFCLTLLLALCLTACGKEPAPQPEPEPQPEPVQAEVYCLPLEYGRLYLQPADEMTPPTLTVDSYCSYYSRQGSEIVAAFEDHSVRRIDMTTGETETLIENNPEYISRLAHYCEDGFVYATFSMADGVDVFRWHKGQTKQLLDNSDSGYELFVSDGALLYSEYDGETDTTFLVALDIDKGRERWRVVPECDYFGMFYQQDDTVYIKCDDGRVCRVEMADGSLTEVALPFDAERFDILHIAGNGSYLLSDYGYISGEPGVYFADESGLRLLDYIPVDEDYCYARALDAIGDKVLVRSSQTHTNTALNSEDSEYDYQYDAYFYHVVDAATGECVTMFVPVSENVRLFENGDFPVLDSSTARKPLTRTIYRLFCEDGERPGAVPVCNTTHGAWLAMADRTSDIALLAAPTEEEQAYLAEKGVEVEMKLYGGDGLVFIGNEACGVTDLTLEQIKSIYRGEITNWSQLGGVDAPIRVLYRDDQSGSQRLFERMVWGDEEVPDYEALGFYRLDEMSTIVNECLYEPYSIGYSIMTYLEDVYGEESLLSFSLEGVSATPENVAAGSYPLSTRGYVVIRADEAADSPARRLYNWFGCPMSDELLTMNGITPIHD